ncbi:MAG: GNAT family N-acetyltransferase [Candidatus Thorarchaeota archaeon]|jgi:GNAT superfamily N-acetyltransferase
MMEIELRPFDPFKATAAEWKNYHQFRYKRYPEFAPGDPITSDIAVEESLRTLRKEQHIETHTVHLKEKPNEQIGLLRLAVMRKDSASYEDNKHICEIMGLSLLKPYRRKGIGSQLLKKVREFAVKHEKNLIISFTSEDDGKAFMRKLKADEALSGIQNRLSLESLDWDMVKQWAKEGPERSPESKLEFFYETPDDIIEEYCAIYTEVMNQAPRDELKVGDYIVTPEVWRTWEEHNKKVGTTRITVITREPNGDISGLTELIHLPSKVPLIFQDLTGVPEKYRGSGKGKWLKAVMLLRVREEYPDIKTVVTGNATSNAPMLSINERLGFKVHRESIGYQIELKKLEKYLKKL